MNIIGNKRIASLLAVLLLICLAAFPACAETAGEQSDKLYAAIDEAGYAYVAGNEGTILYSDPALTEESRCGLLRKKVTLAVTDYTDAGSVEVWVMKGEESYSAYIPRSAVKSPLKENNIVSQAEKACFVPTLVGWPSVYLHTASVKPLVNRGVCH